MTQENECKSSEWRPSAYVLRAYAKDMDKDTRLIDGDIAPYLRKTADYIEIQAVHATHTISKDDLEKGAKAFHVAGGFRADWQDIRPWARELYRSGLKAALAALGIAVR